jgi:hypothetical protein
VVVGDVKLTVSDMIAHNNNRATSTGIGNAERKKLCVIMVLMDPHGRTSMNKGALV